jgi:hypothetical protein
MQNFPIAGLDFNQIKQNFVDFVKSDPKAPFTDFNYEGSGINALLNIFAYNAHYLGYYIKMLLNESFVDSALKRESLISRGKLNGYTPANVKTATAKLKMSITIDSEQDPTQGYLVFPRGYSFSGRNYNEDGRKFQLLDVIRTTERTVDDSRLEQDGFSLITYTTPEFIVHEGTFREWKYEIDSNDLSQQFIIQDKNADLNTLKIYIHPNIYSNDREEYLLATDFFNINKNSKIFFVTTTYDGYYEVFFGNNVFGKKPENGNMIKLSYLISSGAAGNGCKIFSDPSLLIVGSSDFYFNREDYVITTIEESNGGLSEESIDELRFNIPHHYRRQNRMVTESDYRSLLMSKYRNIDSINIWGGEKHFFRDYGSLYICIKPKSGLLLTQTAKSEIESYLKSYAVIGMQIKIIQPQYTFVDISLSVRIDISLTTFSANQIKEMIINDIMTYNELYLDKFDNGLSDFDLLNFLKTDKPYIKRIFDTKRLIKEFTFIPNTKTENIIIFGNALIPGSLSSQQLIYGTLISYIIDDGLGKMWLINPNNEKIIKKSIGTVDYTSGIVKLVIDFDLDMSTNINEITNIIATPQTPDIESYLYNIIKINNIRVDVQS